MTNPVADDFADIAARLAAIKRFDSCVEESETVCDRCEGGGWECYGIGRNDPHFRVCDACGNPEDHPSP